jgi:hypothetical protein
MVRPREGLTDAEAEARRRRYGRLPDPVRLEDTVAAVEAEPVPDPEAGRDTDRDFLLRYAG